MSMPKLWYPKCIVKTVDMSNGNNCPNCGTCLCTGAVLLKAADDRVCCSSCVANYNKELELILKSQPTVSLRSLKFKNRSKI